MEQDPNQQPAGNFVIIETHLQVSNLIKILFTIPYDILKLSVENIPEEVAATQHAKVLRAVLEFYTTIASFSQPPAEVKEEEIAVAPASAETVTEDEEADEDTDKAVEATDGLPNIIDFVDQTPKTESE